MYSIYYFITKLEISDGTSTFLYFGYTAMLTFILFLFTGLLMIEKKTTSDAFLSSRLGTIGFLACFWFVRMIYSVIKVDWNQLDYSPSFSSWYLLLLFFHYQRSILFLLYLSFHLRESNAIVPEQIIFNLFSFLCFCSHRFLLFFLLFSCNGSFEKKRK